MVQGVAIHVMPINQSFITKWAIHKGRHAILDQFGPPPSPLSRFVTHLGPPIFSSTKNGQTPCTKSLSIVRGGFCPGEVCPGLFWLEGFVRGGFCPFLLLSEYIRYNRKLNITFNFRLHMYDKI